MRFVPVSPTRRGKTDDLDVGIIRELTHPQTLQWNARLSYADVARALQADEETVRLRVKRLQDEGVIGGWEIGIHPGVFGRGLVRLETAAVPLESRAKAADALAALDGAHLLFEYYGGNFALVAYQEEGRAAERQAALVAAFTGAKPRISPLPLPPPSDAPKGGDWRILQTLRADPRAPYPALAERAGVSERTFRRRIDALTAGRVLFLNPMIDFSRAGGVLPCAMRVVHKDDSPREEINAELRALPRRVFSWFDEAESRASFVASSLVEVNAARERLERLAAGRAAVLLDLTIRRVNLTGWVDDEIEKRAREAAP